MTRHTRTFLTLLLSGIALPAFAQEDEDEGGASVETTHRVGGALADGPARVESIGKDDLERRGATNLAQALEWMSAGSQVSPTGTSTGLMVDGLPASHVTVLRDGLPITRATGSPQGPIVDLSSIALSPDSIERIDIYRGVGPVGSGAAGGIVIDIISRPAKRASRVFAQTQVGVVADDVVGQNGLGLSSRAHTVSGEAGLSDHFSTEVLARLTDTAPLDVDGDAVPDSPGLKGLGGELGFTWRPKTGDHLRLQLLGSTSDSETLGAPSSVFDDLVSRDSAHGHVAGRWWLNQDVRLDHRSDFGTNRQEFLKRVRSSRFERPKALTKFWDTTQNIAATWFVGDHDLAAEVAGGGYVVNREGETGVLPTRSHAHGGIGVADTWYVSERIETFSRLFAEFSSSYGAALNGQIGGAYRPLKNMSLRTALSTSRRAPTPEELYLFFDHSEVGYQVTGNEELRPEQLYSAQLATLLHTADRSSGVELMGFYHYLTNAITTVGVPNQGGLFTYENREAAHSAGLQATAETAPWKTFTIMGNYTWMPIARDAEDGSRLPLRAEHSARVEVRKSFLSNKLQVWTDASVRSEMPVPVGDPAAAYALMGVGASFAISSYRVMVDANNLLDQTNSDWGPLPGRHLFISLQGSLDFAESD